MRIKSIYDNKGESSDRYTVIFQSERFPALNLSDNCDSPQGFSQFSEIVEGPHLGEEISTLDLPENVRKHLKERMQFKVVITVKGGVATVTENLYNVEVEIVDLD